MPRVAIPAAWYIGQLKESFVPNWYQFIPPRIRTLVRPAYRSLYRRLPSPGWQAGENNKYIAEMTFWRSRYSNDKHLFKNGHYREIMLAMAEESDTSFLDDKIVADFGCGPRGSLVWASNAKIRIGIDVLTNHYFDEFKLALSSHGMIYVQSTETTIPLPSGYVDVLFTLNALDHVDNLAAMASELLRILAPGGLLIGSFNIGEPASVTEPQCLTEELLEEKLLEHLQVISCRVGAQGPIGDQYRNLLDGNYGLAPDALGYMWVKGRKPA